MRYISGTSYRSQPTKKNGFTWKKTGKSQRATHPNEHLFGRKSNPYRSGSRRSTPIPWIPIFLGGALAAWLGLVLYSPYFRITKANYSGLQLIKRDELNQVIQKNFLTPSKWWPTDNYFLVSPASIKQFLEKNYDLENADVRKVFPNGLDINIEEKMTSVIYDDGMNYYLIDQNGAVTRKLQAVSSTEFADAATNPFIANFSLTDNSDMSFATSSTTSTEPTGQIHIPNYLNIRRNYGLYPLVYQITTTSTAANSTKLPKETLQGIIDMYSAIQGDKIALPNYIVMGEVDAGAALVSNQPWKIYFQPNADIQSQIDNIKIILKDNKPTEYIDVRYGDRVFWK